MLHEVVRRDTVPIWRKEILAEVDEEENIVTMNKSCVRNFDNKALCEEEGFTVTHAGHCGSCSNLQVAKTKLSNTPESKISHDYNLRLVKKYSLIPSDSSKKAKINIFCQRDSLFQDLGVYMRQNLTEPTRKCGALGVISQALMRNCLQRIGFSSDCIPIWEYNILNTRKECTAVSSVSHNRYHKKGKYDGL